MTSAIKGVAFYFLIVCVSFSLVVSGCSVFMAASQPGKKDLDVLSKGTPRSQVIEELGAPNIMEDDPEGNFCHEAYAFEQGYSGLTKGGRATFHLAADLFTIGLWEIIGTPMELYFDGTEVDLEVLYDENDRVESVCVYSGRDVVSGGPLVSPSRLRQQVDEAREESLRAAQGEASAADPPSTHERLSELKNLFESGMITQEEYKNKQAEIVEELGRADPEQ